MLQIHPAVPKGGDCGGESFDLEQIYTSIPQEDERLSWWRLPWNRTKLRI